MKKHSSKYKDSVFCLLFNDKDKLRSLYNTLTDSSYNEETPITITTLRNALSEGLHNDISFTIGGKTVVLIEHQSTINPNMPIRLLIYMAAIYENLIPLKELYGRRKIEIPRPEFYLFYNGTSPFPDKTTLWLSNCFKEVKGISKISLELEVQAYNINSGYNKELLEKNQDMGEYARFVAVVREKMAGIDKEDREEAFSLAISECIEHNILKEFLESYREEVMNSLLSISMEEFIQIRTEEAVEEAREEIREEEQKEARKEIQKALRENEEKMRREILEIARKMKESGLPTAQIKAFTGLSPRVIKNL